MFEIVYIIFIFILPVVITVIILNLVRPETKLKLFVRIICLVVATVSIFSLLLTLAVNYTCDFKGGSCLAGIF
jgi:hypothetical protein